MARVVIYKRNHIHTRVRVTSWSEPPHNKTNKMICAPSEDSDQPGHSPSLIRVVPIRLKEHWVFSYPLSAQRRLWSDLTDTADQSICCAHISFCLFCHEAAHLFILISHYCFTRRFIYKKCNGSYISVCDTSFYAYCCRMETTLLTLLDE